LIETIAGRFTSDPDKKVTKRKNDKAWLLKIFLTNW
jgi:hypothetical protein